LDTYLAAVKTVDTGDPKVVEDKTKLLARSLNIKVDQQCFDKPTEQQAPCLVQNPDSLVLDNGRSQSVVQQLTGGSAGDMLSQMSYTQQAGGGYYSVYVGTVIDMAKILGQLPHCGVSVSACARDAEGRYARVEAEQSARRFTSRSRCW